MKNTGFVEQAYLLRDQVHKIRRGICLRNDERMAGRPRIRPLQSGMAPPDLVTQVELEFFPQECIQNKMQKKNYCIVPFDNIFPF